jgi:flagellar protein FlaG
MIRLYFEGDEGVNMSLSVNTAASAAVTPQAPLAKQPNAEPASVAISPAEKAPAVKAEPLFDPQELRANLEAAIERLNQQVESNARGLRFSIDQELDRPVVVVRSTATGEVIRQIPNETVLKVARGLEDAKGLFADHLL